MALATHGGRSANLENGEMKEKKRETWESVIDASGKGGKVWWCWWFSVIERRAEGG